MRGQDFVEPTLGPVSKKYFLGCFTMAGIYNEWTKTSTGELRDLPDGVFTDRKDRL